MNTIFKNKPISQNNKIYNALLYLLTVAATAPMLMPVVVGFMSDFTRVEISPVYLIFRGLAAIAIILAVNVFVINGNTSFFLFAGILTTITVVFPLIDNINTLSAQIAFSQKHGMNIDLSQYLLTVIEYSLFFLVSLITTLYSVGFFRFPVVIMALSLPAAIAAQYDVIVRAVKFEMGLYDVLCFACTVTASLIPLVLVLACKNPKITKSKKYSPKRYA